MTSLAAGTKVFTRIGKLEQLLESLESVPVETVYVADDGEESAKKTELYRRSWEFDLVVLNLEYDAGLGYGRHEIAQVCNEDYLLIVDTDHIVPDRITILCDQLEADPEIGGIAGNIIEPQYGRVQQNAHDLHDKDRVLRRDVNPKNKEMVMLAGEPFVPFDFIPNAAVFRSKCLDDYCWDPEYVIEKEHLDFYVGHLHNTSWKFGVCPSVNFNHYPGGDQFYESNRNSGSKSRQSTEYFLNKWEYESISAGRMYWFDTHSEVEIPYRFQELVEQDGLKATISEAIKKIPTEIRQLF